MRIDLELEAFQKWIVRTVLGADESLILLSRGNGKSCLIGALCAWHLIRTPRAAVFIAACSRQRATVCFEYAQAFAEHPAVAEHGILIRHLELRAPDGGRLRVSASDSPKLHGLTPSLCVIDELHAHSDDSVYLALRTALAKRPGAKLVTISTAGVGVDSPLGNLRARALSSPSVKRSGALTTASAGRSTCWSGASRGRGDRL